jgi:hypothetical protein
LSSELASEGQKQIEIGAELAMQELSIVQKTYDLIGWYVPILNRLPRDHKFALGDRIVSGLYDLLEGLILARFAEKKLAPLQALNGRLDVLRHQTRLLLDFDLIAANRYQHAGKLINAVGVELGGWIKQQKRATQRVKHWIYRDPTKRILPAIQSAVTMH